MPRVLLIDLENSVGSVRPAQGLVRARVAALLSAAGPVHHSVAGYAVRDFADDAVASILAEVGVAPLRVPMSADAAELVLLDHARRVHAALDCRSFVVASADRRFAELASLGRVEVLAWHGQPVAAKLSQAAERVHRLNRPPHPTTPPDSDNPAIPADPVRVDSNDPRPQPRAGLVAGLLIGAGSRSGTGSPIDYSQPGNPRELARDLSNPDANPSTVSAGRAPQLCRERARPALNSRGPGAGPSAAGSNPFERASRMSELAVANLASNAVIRAIH